MTGESFKLLAGEVRLDSELPVSRRKDEDREPPRLALGEGLQGPGVLLRLRDLSSPELR